MFKKISLTTVAVLALTTANIAEARDQIRAVGSSTVYPFITAAAEAFGNKGEYRTPIVESTGTGGGFKLFCTGVGADHPDISNASRAIKTSEKDMCSANGIKNVIELKIGYDGIVLANHKDATRFNISREQIFMALAKQIPATDGKLVDNPHMKWSDVDPALPNTKIEVYGPPPTSGTRDAFVELVMEKPCVGIDAFKAVYEDKKARKKACHLIREDGAYIEAGENDNLIIQKLVANRNALGIFGYSFLDQNLNMVQGSKVEGIEPNFDNISSGDYKVSRPLFVYIKGDHIGKIPGIQAFMEELVSEDAIGEDGYLPEKGLIPLSEDELVSAQERINSAK